MKINRPFIHKPNDMNIAVTGLASVVLIPITKTNIERLRCMKVDLNWLPAIHMHCSSSPPCTCSVPAAL